VAHAVRAGEDNWSSGAAAVAWRPDANQASGRHKHLNSSCNGRGGEEGAADLYPASPSKRRVPRHPRRLDEVSCFVTQQDLAIAYAMRSFLAFILNFYSLCDGSLCCHLCSSYAFCHSKPKYWKACRCHRDRTTCGVSHRSHPGRQSHWANEE